MDDKPAFKLNVPAVAGAQCFTLCSTTTAFLSQDSSSCRIKKWYLLAISISPSFQEPQFSLFSVSQNRCWSYLTSDLSVLEPRPGQLSGSLGSDPWSMDHAAYFTFQRGTWVMSLCLLVDSAAVLNEWFFPLGESIFTVFHPGASPCCCQLCLFSQYLGKLLLSLGWCFVFDVTVELLAPTLSSRSLSLYLIHKHAVGLCDWAWSSLFWWHQYKANHSAKEELRLLNAGFMSS